MDTYNEFNTSLEDLHISELPKEVQDQYYDLISSVPLIKRHLDPNMPECSDLPKDKDGKIIVDVTRPHRLRNMDYFRQSALHFMKYGCYTKLRPNSNPNSEYGKWFRQEVMRCLDGMIRPEDGEWITGDYYFFLNYSPMLVNQTNDRGITNRVVSFPDVWETHYYKFHYILQARERGKHVAELASRSRGKSYVAAAMLAKRFILGESRDVLNKVTCYITAFDRAKLIGGDQTLNKFLFTIDHCAKFTQFPKKRLISTLQNMEWKMGYKDLDTGAEMGTLNSVVGKSLEDESKLRGSRGVLYLFEEAGSFPSLLNSYNNLRPSVEEGDKVFGQLVMYGCVCAGTKVIDSDGNLINIEDVKVGDSLLSSDGRTTYKEHISWRQPNAYKPCVRITTEKGNYIECSTDHPILAMLKKSSKHKNTCAFFRANELKVGDTLLMPCTVGNFGVYHEPDAFLLGALLGDGSYSGHQCVTLSISTEEEFDYYNSKYDIGISKFSKGKNTYAQLYFRGLHPFLAKYGMDKQSFGKKQLPDNIQEWDRESLAEFLSGYFNADGNIQIVKKKHRSIKLSCAYENILQEVKHLLHKFGISSLIYKEHKPGGILHSRVNGKDYMMKETDLYVLYISNSEDIHTFKSNFHFIKKAKQERLNSYNLHYNKGRILQIDFELRDNGKGKFFEGRSFYNMQYVTIKSIEDLGVQQVYNLTAGTTHTYWTNGFVSSNTAGDSDSDFSSLQEIMYNPDGYNVYKIDNVYDKEGLGKRAFSLFSPAYLNLADCYDKDGNSNVSKALVKLLMNRYKTKYNTTELSTLTKQIAEWATTPQEAIMRTTNNMFPVTEINNRIAEIDADPKAFDDVYVGTLVQNSSGEVTFAPTDDTPIRDFPTKNNKVRGALEIYEMPVYQHGKVPYNRYIASLDNYENDISDTMSLGSCFVLDTFTDRIVAEYTGRPDFVDDLNEIVRKICLFYNAKCMTENNKKNTYAYFKRMNCLHLLADTPDWLRQKDIVKTANYGNSAKGVSATAVVIKNAFILLRDWLLKPVVLTDQFDENSQPLTTINLHFIRNRAFLRELSLYNPAGNYDRIMACCQLMLYREEILSTAQAEVGKGNVPDTDITNDEFFKRFDAMFSNSNKAW